jgi:diaminopropionate ammonia-lyase
MLNRTGFRLIANPRVMRAQVYAGNDRAEVLSLAAFADAKREITSWRGYKPTPLRGLSKLAAASGIGGILYKDEGERFGIGSFKALGGAYAVLRLLQRHILAGKQVSVSAQELAAGRYADLVSTITVTCASDGNHGRSVAWGARIFGCRCVIYLPDVVSQGRSRAIEGYGAEVRRIAGTFDDAVRQAAADAAVHGWHVIPDTSTGGSTEAPRDVMQGYCLIIDEALEQTRAIPSHVFVQAGVGGLAAAICAYLWERLGGERPCFVVVEPNTADCFLRSAEAGKATAVQGALHTIMGGLACGEPSPLAWAVLGPGADAFATVGDEAASECMRLLAEGRFGDEPIVAGESAVAGLACALVACGDAAARRCLRLGEQSHILVLGTEGATDVETYRAIVGRAPDDVLALRRAG